MPTPSVTACGAPPERMRQLETCTLAAAMLLCVSTCDAVIPPRHAAPAARTEAVRVHADFAGSHPPHDVRQIAEWATYHGDAAGLPFAVLDKVRARVHVFDRDGRLQASSPVLLGLAPGDDSVPGIGERPIAKILPHERTTPAGRFVAEPGRNSHGEDIVWIDYDVAISMHRVRPTNPKERRLERLATPTDADNRISYGCVNVPVAFYDRYIAPVFGRERGIVYVLPETRTLREAFANYPASQVAIHRTATRQR